MDDAEREHYTEVLSESVSGIGASRAEEVLDTLDDAGAFSSGDDVESVKESVQDDLLEVIDILDSIGRSPRADLLRERVISMTNTLSDTGEES